MCIRDSPEGESKGAVRVLFWDLGLLRGALAYSIAVRMYMIALFSSYVKGFCVKLQEFFRNLPQSGKVAVARGGKTGILVWERRGAGRGSKEEKNPCERWTWSSAAGA